MSLPCSAITGCDETYPVECKGCIKYENHLKKQLDGDVYVLSHKESYDPSVVEVVESQQIIYEEE